MSERYDGWANIVTGVSTDAGRSAFEYRCSTRIPDETLELMYHGDPFVSRICRVVPEEAIRQGFCVKTSQPAMDAWIKARLDELQAPSRITEAWTWGRLYGGGAVILGIDDGQDPEAPLNYGSIRTVAFLAVVDKRDLHAVDWYSDPTLPNYGEPSAYQLTRQGGSNSDTRRIHATRVIRFEGVLTSRRRKQLNGSWSDSEIQRIYDALQAFNGMWASASALLHDASQAVFKMDRLVDNMANDAQDLVKARLRLMDLTRSVGRSILIDTTESFERVETSLTGLPEVVDKFMLRLAGAAEIPVTILMGQAPAGLNATGDSDIRWFYDRIKSAQTSMLQRRLERLIKVLMCSKDSPTHGVEMPEWSIKFNPLWQMTPAEEAALRKSVADTDAIYLTNQVLQPEEVATSRFTDSGWSAETTIDTSVREPIVGELDEEETATAMTPEQTELAISVLQLVAEKKLPREAGLELLEASLPLSEEQCAHLMGDVGDTFFSAEVERPQPADGGETLEAGGDPPEADVPFADDFERSDDE